MATHYVTQFFPMAGAPTDEAALAQRSEGEFVGVCVSGGGSRSLSAAMGQFRALKYLGLWDKVLFLSSVSGGTWASAAYTYLPSEFDEDDFLGRPVIDPGKLTVWQHSGEPKEYALDYLPPNNLGHAPTRLGFLNDLELIIHLRDKYHYANDTLWQGLIGERIFQLWNLWNVGHHDGLPTQSYSYRDWYLQKSILADNPSLSANDFNLVQRARPLLVMNGSMFSNPQDRGSQLLPFESSAVGIGIRNTFVKHDVGPGGRVIGGGEIQPFAMGSAWVADLSSDQAKVTIPSRPFSLVDMAAISSSAFAEVIQDHLHWFDSLLPKFQYWPVYERATTQPYDYYFADGGLLENLGMLALLARNVKRVIAFVNTNTPLALDDEGQIMVSSDIHLLFGKVPPPSVLQYKEPKQQVPPNGDPSFNRVFDEKQFDELRDALWQKNGVNGDPAVIKQRLWVYPNPNFAVFGNYEVEVLWVYNTGVPRWRSLLTWEVNGWIDLEASNFPNYDTVLQLGLSAGEVNALAQLSFWVLLDQQDLVMSMFE